MVRVLWDPMPDVGGYEEAKETDQWLLPSKWKKEVDGAWRMDVEVDVEVNRNNVTRVQNVNMKEMAESENESDESEESDPETSDSNNDSE